MGKTVHDIRVKVLTAHFGADYQAYVKRTKRLISFIY